METQKKPFRVLEFYSGIGGMHYSLMKAFPNNDRESIFEVVESIDINSNANSIYEHNFKRKPLEKSIERITLKQFDKLSTDVWLMSPPCQPYTRQGNQLGSQDARSSSFTHLLISILPEMTHPPQYILVENVKGFEESDTHQILINQLRDCDYIYQEFLLSPTQLKIPNSRLRYYLLAKKKPHVFANPEFDSQLINFIPKSDLMATKKQINNNNNNNNTNTTDEETVEECTPISNYLEPEEVSSTESFWEKYKVPDNVILKYGRLFDIVTKESKRSNCFTKGYFHFVEGTGSVIQTADQNLQGIPGDSNSLLPLKLRYFTPTEVANLMGFPIDGRFNFPSDMGLKQRYKALGNSLNVTVVSELLRYMFLNEGVFPKEEKEDVKEELEKNHHSKKMRFFKCFGGGDD